MGENKENELEVILARDADVKPGTFGLRLGLLDINGNWYNTTKKKVNNDSAWEILSGLKKGDHVHLKWIVREYSKKDQAGKLTGEIGHTSEITWFDKIIRGDSVDSAPAPAQGVAPDRQPAQSKDDLIAKESAYKSGAQFMNAVGPGAVAEWVGIMSEGPAGLDEYLKAYTIIAHALYADMQGDWSCGK